MKIEFNSNRCKEDIRCLQVNLNRSRAAQTLLEQTVREKGIDIALIMEPNRKIASKGNWIMDKEGNTAIQIRDREIKIEKEHRGDGYAYVVVEGGLMLCACYVSPICKEQVLEGYLENITSAIRVRILKTIEALCSMSG